MPVRKCGNDFPPDNWCSKKRISELSDFHAGSAIFRYTNHSYSNHTNLLGKCWLLRLASVCVACAAGWRGSGVRAVSCGREPQDFCELLHLSVFARPTWAKQLGLAGVLEWHGGYHHAARARAARSLRGEPWRHGEPRDVSTCADSWLDSRADARQVGKIGRASCRERV